jgi:hypothetical protein
MLKNMLKFPLLFSLIIPLFFCDLIYAGIIGSGIPIATWGGFTHFFKGVDRGELGASASPPPLY